MLVYVTMHLLNHAVGLVSLESNGKRAVVHLPGLVEPPGASHPLWQLRHHYWLALWALWQRRSLRLRASELSQIVLGFAIPILLVRHVVGTRIADSFFGTDGGYYAISLGLISSAPRSRSAAASGSWSSPGHTR